MTTSGHDQGKTSDDFEMMCPEIIEVSSDSENGDDVESMENSFEESSGEEEIMKSTGETLGLEHEINPQVCYRMQNDGHFPFPTNNSQPPRHSPEIIADSVSSAKNTFPLELNRACDLLMAVSVDAGENKTKIIEIAVSAMEELIRKAFAGEPLWQRQEDSDTEILNEAEYLREFRAFDASLKELMRMVEMGEPQKFANLYHNLTSGVQGDESMSQQDAKSDLLQTEASRQIGIVSMNATSLVECLVDINQWSSIFSNIISRATILGVLSRGVSGSYDQSLQVMRAEFHMSTPLVPVRDSQFARFCKYLGSGTWGVVDVSLDSIFPNPLARFRRRPSGCLIQEMHSGYCKVTWVEHVEVETVCVHKIFRPIVLSGFSFGATRWMASVVRHCESAGALTSSVIHIGSIPPNGKESLLKLADRMMKSFYQSFSASPNNFWVGIPLDGAEDFRLMTKSIYAFTGRPSSTLVFTTSLWVPSPTKRVFDFLRRADSRKKWDLLAQGFEIEETLHVIKGEKAENRVAILQVNSGQNQIEILYLQESYSDPTGSYVIYAPLDMPAMAMALSGGNPDNINILPSGFVVHPDRPLSNGEDSKGSLLTLAFHIMNGSSTKDSISLDSVQTIHRIVTETAFLIKEALLSDDL